MIRAGVAFMFVATVLWFLAIPLTIVDRFGVIFLPSSIVIGGLGVVLVFIGVVRDRIKEKQEEDPDDLSKY